MTLVTQAVFSRMCRTSRKTVTKWKQEGRLVMNGQQIDVEATAERLQRCARRGSPIVLTPEEAARPFASEREAPNTVPGAVRARTNKPVSMLCTDIVADLESMDWEQSFDWSPAAQAERVRKAAECVGCVAAESEVRDDGHWGGFQLRRAEEIKARGLSEDAVIGGWGFELGPYEALKQLRKEIEPFDDDDRERVRVDLLPLLAHPWDEYDNPEGSK